VAEKRVKKREAHALVRAGGTLRIGHKIELKPAGSLGDNCRERKEKGLFKGGIIYRKKWPGQKAGSG